MCDFTAVFVTVLLSQQIQFTRDHLQTLLSGIGEPEEMDSDEPASQVLAYCLRVHTTMSEKLDKLQHMLETLVRELINSYCSQSCSLLWVF